uniref:Uncharacterized protein n=1 Tax=Oncorhynchus tshawytscha TaxID=74940 RepID=A0AAZ3QY20_ONCTS
MVAPGCRMVLITSGPMESCTIRFLDRVASSNLSFSRSLFEEGSGCGQVMVNQQALPNIGKVLLCYQVVKEARLLLPVEFSTLSEYLHHLKAAAQALRPIGSKAMFYLAAAVSDFYIPASEMPEHKIQSSNGPLQVSKENGPQDVAFGISFKLEMDPSILLDRARRGYVVVVTPYTQAKLVLTDEEASKDVEIEDSIVSNLTRAHGQFITQQD